MRSRRGIAVALACAVIPVIGPSAVGAVTRTCTGFAPTQTSCTTGSFTSTAAIGHDVSADINYVGTVESALVWGSNARIFRCTFAPGIDRRCVGIGEFPPLFATFSHQCRSLMPGTAFQAAPGVGIGGIEGGVGTWSCTVTV